jgi:ABC-type lipoprotein export system ATPase subunit
LLRDVATQGVTVIAATHDPFVIEHVDRVLEMSDGHMLPEGEGSLIAQHRRRGVEVPRPRTDSPPVRR